MHLLQLTSASFSALFLQLAFGYVFEVPEAVKGHEVSARIFGGYDADISDFPFQVRLEIQEKQNGVIYGTRDCGGSIISQNFILTAAHCVVQANATLDPIKAESLYVNANRSIRKDDIRFPVKNIFPHPRLYIPPEWYELVWTKDVAILELFNPLPLGPGIQIIPLAKADTTLPEGTKASISGWGNTSLEQIPKRLQTAEVSIAPKEACEYCYGKKEDGICAGTFEDIFWIFLNGPLTAIFEKTIQTKGVLRGDSGGPLVINGVLEGVAQARTINIEGSCPDLFVRVASSDIRAFIKNVTGI